MTSDLTNLTFETTNATMMLNSSAFYIPIDDVMELDLMLGTGLAEYFSIVIGTDSAVYNGRFPRLLGEVLNRYIDKLNKLECVRWTVPIDKHYGRIRTSLHISIS